MNIPLLLAQAAETASDASETATPQMPPGAGAALGVIGIIYFVFLLLIIISMWKIFTKAGRPGWYSLIPIVNGVVLCHIAGKSGWWLLLCIFVIPALFLSIALAEKFGKGAGFGVGLFFLGFIFLPMLAFGDAQYRGAGAPPPLAA